MKIESDTLKGLLTAFSRVIHDRRERLGLSQEELARRSMLHRTYISDIERGARNVSLKNIVRLAGALDMSITELVGLTESQASTEAGLSFSNLGAGSVGAGTSR